MKKLTTITSTTQTLATETNVVSYKQVLGLMKDLTGEAGYQATAKDLFTLVHGGRNGIYEKLVFVLTEGPIKAFSVQKLGGIYTVLMEKSNRVELYSTQATTLINIIENYKPGEEEIRLDTFKGKCLISVREALTKSEKERGRHAKASDVLRHLVPGMKMKSGHYFISIPQFQIKFTTLLGHTIIEVTDHNNFRRQMNMAKDLRDLVGY